MPSIGDHARELFQFRNDLLAIGFTDKDTAEVIRRCGAVVPIYGRQIDGVFIRSSGQRDRHFATHGWYSILSVQDKTIQMKKLYVETADVFECGTYWFPSVVMANLEMMDGGRPSPDNQFVPQAIPSSVVAMSPVLLALMKKVVEDGGRFESMTDFTVAEELLRRIDAE